MRVTGWLMGTWVSVALTAAPALAVAGPYADEMGKCLVEKTSPEDRAVLVQWMFSLMARHPDVQPLSAITSQQRDALTASAGQLFNRLLLESCRTQTQQAFQNEGPRTIEYAFRILGEVAMRGLMGNPSVVEGLKDLGKSMDEKKLDALIQSAPPVPASPPPPAVPPR